MFRQPFLTQTELDVLNVHPDYQRNGLGARLVNWGIDMSEEKGWQSVIVSTKAGYPLYTKCGYDKQEIWYIDLDKLANKGGLYFNAILTRYPKERRAESAASQGIEQALNEKT